MRHVRVVPILLSTLLLAACTSAPSPNDSASRALNEMKAVARPIPPKPDPRDLKIADLERQKADLQREKAELEAELAKLRSSAAADLDQSKARITELENQLNQRDRELAGLRNAAGDKDRLASQLSDADRQLSAKDQELAALRQGAGDKDRLAGELAALQGLLASKEQELAGLKSNAGDRDRLSSELAQAKQRIAELERQLHGKDQELGTLKAAAGDRDRLVADLAAAKQRASDLESEIARRDHEMAGLRGALDQQKTSLAEAKNDLSKLLQAEVAKGNVTMKQLGDQLTLGLATTLLFDSGEATLKPGGADVLNRIGSVLKNYPDRSIHVAGHTDNVPIKGRLAKRFPTNAELSQARADSARQALTEGGMAADKIVAKGHADSRPIASNSTAEGRQKNRRVEIVVGQ
ncbi:OmpA family protein [Nitrospira defluvii]|uniref:Flagellar motor rotation protein MotB n=1 Tax=Nitrospira defluvii TaxID=330214 RepID=A0ABM8QP07_9BACT|nr:OmpA family protein [Nitrospira defluvii]CAE6707556.1 Flagellar motor rotation protein MotB [Nitrospira defluvii]